MEKENKVECLLLGDHLYIEAPKSKFVPGYVYYLLESKKCNKVTFGTSKKIYKKEDLKGKKDWKEVK